MPNNRQQKSVKTKKQQNSTAAPQSKVGKPRLDKLVRAVPMYTSSSLTPVGTVPMYEKDTVDTFKKRAIANNKKLLHKDATRHLTLWNPDLEKPGVLARNAIPKNFGIVLKRPAGKGTTKQSATSEVAASEKPGKKRYPQI